MSGFIDNKLTVAGQALMAEVNLGATLQPTRIVMGSGYMTGSMTLETVTDVITPVIELDITKKKKTEDGDVSSVTIGGVRTNFRMPDVISIGLGGGSIVRQKPDGSVTVGPDSVGYRITDEALVFGGSTLTATDVAVRLGMARIGDPAKVAQLDEGLARKAMERIVDMVEEAIDSMKLSASDVTVILAGGGSIIVPPSLKGAKEVIVPSHSDCANAIGSAISKVSGNYEKLVSYDEIDRDKALKLATNEAVLAAMKAGAKVDSVEVVEMEDVPLQYYPGNMVRIRIKVAGDLA